MPEVVNLVKEFLDVDKGEDLVHFEEETVKCDLDVR